MTGLTADPLTRPLAGTDQNTYARRNHDQGCSLAFASRYFLPVLF
jgi:hypothetical protein